jgi:hypothetical protein
MVICNTNHYIAPLFLLLKLYCIVYRKTQFLSIFICNTIYFLYFGYRWVNRFRKTYTISPPMTPLGSQAASAGDRVPFMAMLVAMDRIT